MAPSQARPIGRDDLERAVRSVARHFDTDRVFVIGSQALLVGRADIARTLRMSAEVDAYPGNAADWEAKDPNGSEASEEINAIFGEGSSFHTTHGFYIDGVDENTASLGNTWQDRAQSLHVEIGDGRTVEAIAPHPSDLVAAKLVRGEPKDLRFTSLCLQQGLTKHSEVKKRLQDMLDTEALTIAIRRLNRATQAQSAVTQQQGFGF